MDDPVAAGTTVSYVVAVTNHGTNTAYDASVDIALASDLAFLSAPEGCTHVAGLVTCEHGNQVPGATVSRTITASVPANLVYANGGPKTISSTATVADLTTTAISTSGALAEMIIGTPESFTLTRTTWHFGEHRLRGARCHQHQTTLHRQPVQHDHLQCRRGAADDRRR